MTRKFKVILEWDEEYQVYAVMVPSLPSCVTRGKVGKKLCNA